MCPCGPRSQVGGMWPGSPRGPGLAFEVLLTTPGRCWRVVCAAGAQGGDRGGVIMGRHALQPIPARHRSPGAGDLEEGLGERRGMGCPAAAPTPVTAPVFAALSLCNMLSRSPCPNGRSLNARGTTCSAKKTPQVAASTPDGNPASARCGAAFGAFPQVSGGGMHVARRENVTFWRLSGEKQLGIGYLPIYVYWFSNCLASRVAKRPRARAVAAQRVAVN